MVETKLVESKIEDGETLLRELDRQNFPVEAMFWINRPEIDWRLIVGSGFVTEQGTRAGYHRLSEIYDKLDLLGLALEDITLLDPNERPFLSLRSLASQSSRVAAGKYWSCTMKRSYIAGTTPSLRRTSRATPHWMT
jgi:hypothetical protein